MSDPRQPTQPPAQPGLPFAVVLDPDARPGRLLPCLVALLRQIAQRRRQAGEEKGAKK
jgi:hypothetical protein